MADTEENLISSDDEDTDVGHPVENKAIVLKNLAEGFKYHKNGPAQPYDWNKKDMKIMTDLIQKQSAQLKKGRRKIRAVKFDGTEFPDGLLGWVNNVRNGTYFSDNPNVHRGPVFKSGEKSNHWLWNFVSVTLLSEFEYWSRVHQENQKVDPSEARYPNLHQLVFRHTDDFVGGLWSDFSKYWEPFISEMR